MKLKRLAASVSARFDSFIDKMENHEAVAEAAITDVKLSAAEVKAQLSRLTRQLKQLQDQQETYCQGRQKWQSRAVTCANKGDEDKALQCMKRASLCEKNMAQVEQQIQQQKNLADQVQSNLDDIERHLADLQLKKNSLASREHRTKVVAIAQGDELNGELNKVFERWEVQVAKGEYLSPAEPDQADVLESEFCEKEEAKELKAALDILLRDSNKDK